MFETKLKSHARAIAPLLTSAVLLSLAACKTPQLQSASPDAVAPIPAAPRIDVKLTPTYQAIAKRDFGTQNDQLESIIKQITAAKPDQYAEIELQLLGVLQSPDATTPAKIFALDMLRVTASKISIPTCAALLADKDLTHNARRVLAGLNTPESNAALRNALGHIDGNGRIGIINTLGDLRDNAAVPLLTPLAKDANTSFATFNALGKIGSIEAADALDSAIPKESSLLAPWAAAYLNCAETILSGDSSRANPRATKMLFALYEGSYPSAIKAGAFTAICNHIPNRANEFITKELKSPDPLIRRAARSAAVTAPGNDISKNLAYALTESRLGDPSSITKADKIEFLAILAARGDRGDRVNVTNIVNTLASEKTTDNDVRLAAINALSTLGDKSSVPILAAALKSPGPLANAAWQTLADLDDPAVTEALLKQVNSGDTAVRAAVINALAEKHIAALLPVARAAVDDPDAAVSETALKALGTIGELDDFKSLLERLKKNPANADTIANSLSAIVRRNDKEKNNLADLVIASIAAGDSANHARLLPVLNTIGNDKARQKIIEAMLASKNDVELRKSAARILSNWPNAAPLNDLLKAAKTDADEGVKILALQGYIRMASNNGNPNEKVNRLKSAYEAAARPEEKRRAIAGIGNIPTAEALKALDPLLTDADTKSEAYSAYEKIAETLTKSNPALAKSALEKVATDAPSPQLKDKAKRAAEGIK